MKKKLKITGVPKAKKGGKVPLPAYKPGGEEKEVPDFLKPTSRAPKYDYFGLAAGALQAQAENNPGMITDSPVHQWFRDYTLSPAYQLRLRGMGVPDEDYFGAQDVVNEPEKNLRTYQLPADYRKDTRGEMVGSFGTSDYKGWKEYENILHPNFQPPEFDILLDPVQNAMLDPLTPVTTSTLGHEISHKVRKLVPKEMEEFVKRNKDFDAMSAYEEAKRAGAVSGNDVEQWMYSKGYHDTMPGESKADLDALRYMMQQQGIYDVSKDGYLTPEVWEKVKSNPAIKKSHLFQRMQKHFEDKDIIELNNLIAGNVNGNAYAKFGGQLPEYGPGGQRPPLYVTSKNDPRYRAYLDSMIVHNKTMDYANKLKASKTYEDWMDVVYHGYDKNSADANNRLLKYNKINYLEPARTYEKKLLNERGQDTPTSAVGIYARPVQEVIIGRKKDTVAPLAGTKPSPLMTYTPQPVPLPTFYQPYLAPEGPATGPDEFLYDAGSGMSGFAFQHGGKVNPPIHVPVGDPRIGRYTDSLDLHNWGEDMWNIINSSKTNREAEKRIAEYEKLPELKHQIVKSIPKDKRAIKREEKVFGNLEKPDKNTAIILQDRYAQPVQPYLPLEPTPPVTQTTEWNEPMYAEPLYDQNGNLIGRRDIGNPGYAQMSYKGGGEKGLNFPPVGIPGHYSSVDNTGNYTINPQQVINMSATKAEVKKKQEFDKAITDHKKKLLKEGRYEELAEMEGLRAAEAISPVVSSIPGLSSIYKDLAYKYANKVGAFGDSKVYQISGADTIPKEDLYDNVMEYFDKDPVYGKRKLLHQYIYGDQDLKPIDLPTVGLDKYYKRYGNIPKYELRSETPHGDTLYLPENYYKDIIKRGKEIEPGVYATETDAWNPVNPKDDIAGHMMYMDTRGKTPMMTTRDIWKFDPRDYTKKWSEGYEPEEAYRMDKMVRLLERAGHPFILMQQNPVKLTAPTKAKEMDITEFVDPSDPLGLKKPFTVPEFVDPGNMAYGGKKRYEGGGEKGSGPYPVEVDWDRVKKAAELDNSLIDWDLMDKSVNATQLLTDAAQFTPIAPYAYVGSLPLTTYNVARDWYKGNYGDMALDALGYIPGYRAAKMPITLAKDARRAAQVAAHAKKVKNATNYNRAVNVINTGWDAFNVGRDQFGNYGGVPTSDNVRVAPIPMYQRGGEYEVDALELDRLRKLGYKVEIL